ncbi:MAG TPA: DUF1028 domain-containing protein, partial [Thermoanaerobaculia bacterium]|nr:DUF1028 domain-containing protein [Thermoanaerobaculia bacterium]
RIVDLRPGTYTVTFSLPGFNVVKREGIELTGSFTATVNVELRVGALEETITVTGETPVVDIQNTTQQRVVGREVIDAVADHFEGTAGSGMPLAERLILALQAGQEKGGDKRWGLLQSAAIRVADPNDFGRGGDHLSVSIDVGEHADPLGELYRIYRTTQRRLGYRSFSEVQGRDVVELKRCCTPGATGARTWACSRRSRSCGSTRPCCAATRRATRKSWTNGARRPRPT